MMSKVQILLWQPSQMIYQTNAVMVELADTLVSRTGEETRAGSSPANSTTKIRTEK